MLRYLRCLMVWIAAMTALTVRAENPRTFIDLNGAWETRANKALEVNFPPADDAWEAVTIPEKDAKLIKRSKLNWKLVPVKDIEKEGLTDFLNSDGHSAWYRKSFTMPAKQESKTVQLVFARLLSKGIVWVNGQQVGETMTGASETRFDITASVKWGEANDLTVWVGGIPAIMDLEREMYLTPVMKQVGVCGDVGVEIMNALHIEDVHVITSVRKKTITVNMTVANRGVGEATFTPACNVVRNADRRPAIDFSGEPVTLDAGATQVVTISRPWADPILWDRFKPFLYNALCTLNQEGRTDDLLDQRFGFREFWIEGREFRLNGKPTTLLRDSAAFGGQNDYESIVTYDDPRQGPIKSTALNPYNHFRLWSNSPIFPRFADEIGVTLDPSLAKFFPALFPVEKPRRDLWLPNLVEHLQKVVRSMRNNPSVIIWNMTNENYWGQVPDNPDMKEICQVLVDAVRAVDQTRPLDGDAEVGWDGLLDIISIHYPRLTGELALEFPNSDYVIPNDIYWLEGKTHISNWRAEADLDRPLTIGEYSNGPSKPDGLTAFGGEAAYDWIRAEREPLGKKWLHLDLLSKITDVYRTQQIVCLNPWTEYGHVVMPTQAVRPLDFHPNFFSGETATRKFVVHYEGSSWLHDSKLRAQLVVDGETVWEHVEPLTVNFGSTVFDVDIEAPEVTQTTKATLILSVFYSRWNTLRPVLAQHKEPVYLMPRTSLADVDTSQIVLYAANGNSASRLAEVGLKLEPIASLQEKVLAGKRLLLVDGETPFASNKEKILAFAKAGGTVLFLQRTEPESLGLSFPEMDKKHVASLAWKRSFDHPVLDGLENDQLHYWRPDNLVSKRTFSKPIDGDTRVLLDCGGLRGMEWTPLCETPMGKGLLLFSQLSLLDRLQVEPAAGDMLSRLVRYGLTASAPPTRPLRVLMGDNAPLQTILTDCRIDITKGLDGTGPVLWDATYTPSADELKALTTYLAQGGTVWCHGFAPETCAIAGNLLPFTPELREIDATKLTAVKVADSPLLNNISNGDFLWAQIKSWAWGDYFAEGKRTAKLGDFTLALPNLQAGTPLLAPALLTSIPVGKGTVLFDTVAWETAYDKEGERVTRAFSALAMNIGATIKKMAGAAYDYFPVSLAEHANMGYVDEVPDDGKGGWLDMGRFDLCFFLTNHTERLGGDGAPIGVEPFPENTRFRNIPFFLVAPKKNNGKSVIALRGSDRALKLPDKVEGIPVGHKADALWFIHGASYITKQKGVTIAKYVIHYADGSSTDFPIRSGIEINDWSSPIKPEKAVICWTGNNRAGNNYGVYLTRWNNPSPDKAISTIDVVGAFTTAQLGLIGIAGGVKKDDMLASIAHWDFATLADGVVRDSLNQVPLNLVTPDGVGQPTVTDYQGEPVLNLNGHYLQGKLSEIPGFDAAKPTQIDLVFGLGAQPTKDNGYSLFQASNMRSGFRLFVEPPTMPPGCMPYCFYYPTEDGKATVLRSQTSLAQDKLNLVSLRFDASGAKLYVNGSLSVMSGGGMPLPYDDVFYVGMCQGATKLCGQLKSLVISQ